MASAFPSSKETSNYARLCRLLMDVGSQALRDTFDAIHPPVGLHTVLSCDPEHVTLRSLRKKRILNPFQWEKLFPTKPSCVTSERFDFMLLTVLLKSICGLLPPSTGWHSLPRASDFSKEANIARLIYYSDAVYRHVSQASVDDVEFKSYWQDISKAIIGLAGPGYVDAIFRVKNECMDPVTEEQYKKQLKQCKKYFEEARSGEQTVQLLELIKSEVQSIFENLEIQMTKRKRIEVEAIRQELEVMKSELLHEVENQIQIIKFQMVQEHIRQELEMVKGKLQVISGNLAIQLAEDNGNEEQIRQQLKLIVRWLQNIGDKEAKIKGVRTLTEARGDVSVSSASSVFPSQATKQEQEIIVATAMKFEAEHKELVRVLVYSEGGVSTMVHLYVQCGELGIPQKLKNAALEFFGEMDVKLEWLDLVNDADRILKIRPLECPSGKPRSLTDSLSREISETIRDNFHVLVKHRNITALEPSLKITGSKQTDTPCITLYVLRKGFIPDGECAFPLVLGSYPVDVVDGFWLRTDGPWKPNEAQEKSEVLRLGASIGVQGKDSAGTLGAIVKGGDRFYALSCDHVMKHESNLEIIHPAQNDHLNYLKYHLQEYGSWLRNIVHMDIPLDLLNMDNLTGLGQLNERFIILEHFRRNCRDSNKETVSILKEINEHEDKFKEGRKELPRVIGRYSAGVSRNVTWHGRPHYIDAAVAELTPDEVRQLQRNPTVVVIGTGYKPSGEVNLSVEAEGKLHQSGRTTGYTGSGEFTDHHLFLACSLCELNPRNPALLSLLREVKLCVLCAQRTTRFATLGTTDLSCDYCSRTTSSLRDILWLYNCLCIKTKGPFPDKGDSGAVLFEMDERRQLRGFGIMFGVHGHSYQRYVLASPLNIALKTLANKISVDNLRLLSNYGE